MILFRVIREEFISIDGAKFHSRRRYPEQGEDGAYMRPMEFFVKHRKRMLEDDVKLISPSTMKAKYVGKGAHAQAIRIGGVVFPYNQWVEVPLNFNSFDEKGQDLFGVLGFAFSRDAAVKTTLEDYEDGGSILVLRKYGGLGDVLMQSMIFPELRRRYPMSRISYATPPQFMSLYEHCTDIDEVLDAGYVQTEMYRYFAGEKVYDVIADISSSCAAYECHALDTRGQVDKQRPDIWAEGFGLKLEKHESCIRLTHDEIRAAERFLGEDDRPIIGFAPFSANYDRSYPYGYIQPLIDGLNDAGYRVMLIHSKKLDYKNCEMLAGLELRKLGAVISRMACMISTDTGPLHYAGILGIPVIGLFGVTDSAARLKYYDAIAMQGICEKGLQPCWARRSADCRPVKSKGRVGAARVTIASDMASCMFIEPVEIIANVMKLLAGKRVQKEVLCGLLPR